ncbi:hypothetical protein DPMN_059568 [Dreissena polymorpha]|uniref:Uncharacterized protein n=1 Tax=Dreissena polymorpha TaxID=45954 RepID=A0A9D4HGS5_DREPO|nr:hypothetical protein DPMN_059568 [Dreissena polymorpha]
METWNPLFENIRNIVSLKKGKAILEVKDGERKLQYILSNALGVDSSQTNTIGSPERVEGCLELLHFLASQKPANCIDYDRDEISVSYDKLYRNGKEFKGMNKLLGTGISGGVVVVKDKTTGTEHGLKTDFFSLEEGKAFCFELLWLYKHVSYKLHDQEVSLSVCTGL